ncbi:hypothetical protein FRX31_014173 [Thalictrum thalictroides]|uniref:Uncharacterized protein n=1 Tax=Thalictrum thalictroides TaxID=46969 RepID=A0A7J6WFN8_THATH|nr:hypothetical protein FRX31_014173 [Thalictrum thalictroides]
MPQSAQADHPIITNTIQNTRNNNLSRPTYRATGTMFPANTSDFTETQAEDISNNNNNNGTQHGKESDTDDDGVCSLRHVFQMWMPEVC